MSSSLSIFRNRSAQVPVYLEIATCLPLMNMSRIVILLLACTFISFPFTKNSYEESKPGNKNDVQLEEGKPRKNVNIRIAISTWLGTPFNKLI